VYKGVKKLPKYVCVIIDRNGQKIKQKIEGPSTDAVSSMLKTKGNYLVSIKEETIFDKDIEFFGNGVLPSKQIAVFARQFSMLLKAGVSVSGALDILRDQLDDKRARKITEMTYQEVLKGLSLSAAMKATKRLPDLFVNMVEAGETGGFLDDVMERMATYYEKDNKIVAKVKNAMIYPCVVLVVTLVVVYILITQVVPQFVTMFDTMGVELPWTTKTLIALSEFFNKWWWLVFLILGSGIFALFKYVSTPRGRLQKDTILMNIPLLKSILLKSIVARFTRTLSIMVRTGVPMLKAIEFSAKVVNNKVVERGLMKVADEVAAGKSLSAPIQNMKLFPKMVISLVKTGEETGALDEMMDKCADFYDDEVANLSERLTTLLEPLIIIILAGTVGFIVMSVLQPMFTMYNTLSF
jgi:type IV pilus assembly protein PilC